MCERGAKACFGRCRPVSPSIYLVPNGSGAKTALFPIRVLTLI